MIWFRGHDNLSLFLFKCFTVIHNTKLLFKATSEQCGSSVIQTLAEPAGVTEPSLVLDNDTELYWFSIDLYHLSP